MRRSWLDGLNLKDLTRWSKLNLFWFGKISSTKMNVLPKLNFLFQMLPIAIQDKKLANCKDNKILLFIIERSPESNLKHCKMKRIGDSLFLISNYIIKQQVWYGFLTGLLMRERERLMKLETTILKEGLHNYLWGNSQLKQSQKKCHQR